MLYSTPRIDGLCKGRSEATVEVADLVAARVEQRAGVCVEFVVGLPKFAARQSGAPAASTGEQLLHVPRSPSAELRVKRRRVLYPRILLTS